ncbi:MAG: hypothetical protein RL701_5802 [Pseudomonadota bacterium]|jgi:hypothetical protein
MSDSLKLRVRRRAAKAREGAVLVEGVIVAASMVILFGCILVIHLYCSLQISKLDEARTEVWNSSMPGCGGDDAFDVRGMTDDLKSGNYVLLPDGMMPEARDAARSFSIRKSVFGQVDGHREIKFLCNPRPTQKTMNETVNWVLDAFL